MSQRHPGARRTSHKSDHEADDLFVARILDVSRWAQGNQQLLTIVGVIVVIFVAGLVYYGRYQGDLNNQAAEQLEMVHQSIGIGDAEGAKGALAVFLERFGGTAFAGEARLVLGELYLESDESQQAMAVLEPLGRSPRSPIEFQGAALLGQAYEQEARWAEAEETYLMIADRSELSFQVRDALASAARIRGSRGDVAGAIELYEEVLEALEETSAARGLYEMRIEELRTAANS